MIDWQAQFAARAEGLKASAIRETAKFAAQPGVISFASGSPNPSLFPYEAMSRAMSEIMADPAQRVQALQYGPSEGYLPLRELIVAQLNQSGARIAPANVMITNGSQQALEFIAKLFVDPGERIVVTDPTYLGALQSFGLFEPRYVGIPADGDGLDLAALERAFAEGAKFMYLMPDFGNPSGMTLSLQQRSDILSLARRYRMPIVEDQAYRHLRFTDEALPPLLALDAPSGEDGLVIHLGTFSKTLSPGLRVGWIVAPEAVIAKLVFMKQASDLQGGSLNQMIVHKVATAIFDGHVEALRAAYRDRRDRTLRALARHMPQSVRWSEPDGGMFIWLALPEPLDATELQAVAVREKVVFVPGAPFFANGGGRETVRLSFSGVPLEQIDIGIERLARAIRQCLDGMEAEPSASVA